MKPRFPNTLAALLAGILGLGAVPAMAQSSSVTIYGIYDIGITRVSNIGGHLTAMRRVGVPYSDTDIKQASIDIAAQADPDVDAGDFLKRYPKAEIRDFDGDAKRLTEMDAVVAYLQVLGTMVDFNAAAAKEQPR